MVTSIVMPAVIVAVVGVLLSAVLVFVLARFAPRWRLLDYPGGRKQHEQAVPLVGGLGIMIAGFIAFGVGAIWWRHLDGFSWWLLLGVGLMLAAGVLDDALELPHWTKAVLQVIAILPIVFLAGAKISVLGPLFGGDAIQLGYFAIPFTLLCLIGYINAENMIDGLDGLAGGIAFIALVLLAACALAQGLADLFLTALAFAAATLAFLVFNLRTPWRSRAAVFLGDAGSMALGLVVGWCAIKIVSQPGHHAVSPIGIAWVLALPVMDTLVVMTRRLKLRRNPFTPDRLHLHHVLVDIGLSPAQATAGLLLLSLLYGIFGLAGSLAGLPDWILFVSFLSMLALHAAFVSLSQRHMLTVSLRMAHRDPVT